MLYCLRFLAASLACGLVDEGGTIGARSTRPTGEGTDGEALYATLTGLVDEVMAQHPSGSPGGPDSDS
mgnify:CR=1 FL=1